MSVRPTRPPAWTRPSSSTWPPAVKIGCPLRKSAIRSRPCCNRGIRGSAMPCDAGDMFVIHRVFRREFADLPALIAAVPAGDAERAAIVGDHVKFIVAALHHHHAAEDDLAWPRLQSRAP